MTHRFVYSLVTMIVKSQKIITALATMMKSCVVCMYNRWNEKYVVKRNQTEKPH